MSKKCTARNKARRRRLKASRGAVVALAIALVATGVAVTRLSPLRRSSPAPAAAPTQPDLRLSKEYIYAGGRLVATEEPGGVPSTPTELRHVELARQTEVQLIWRDNSDDEAGFKVERSPYRVEVGQGVVKGAWIQVATVGPDVTAFNIPNCDSSFYRVRAFNAAGDSPPSNEDDSCYGYGGGDGPTDLIATAQLSTQVALTWTQPSGAVARYEVERSQGTSGTFERLLPDPTTPSFTDSGASPRTAYLYRVRAVRPDETFSAYSNQDLATTVIFSPVEGRLTVIEARHLNERRQAVSAVRALAGLGPASWTYPDPVSSPAAARRKIYYEDVQELRTRLDEALLKLGRLRPYPADPPLARGAPVRAALFTQISDRVE